MYHKLTKEDKPSIILNTLSLLFPIIGIILYFIWKNKLPTKAKNLLTCSLIGWAIGIISYLFT